MRSSPKPKQAHSIIWQVCNCGCQILHLALVDGRGRAIATAQINPVALAEMVEAVWPPAEVERDESVALH